MRVLLTGASGQLGTYLLEGLLRAGHEVTGWRMGVPLALPVPNHGALAEPVAHVPLVPVDLTDAGSTERRLAEADPEVIVHAAALSAADAVYRDPERGRAINVDATGRLADWAARRGRRLIFTSTDLVFDGTRAWNREDDPATPILAYGRTKRAAEPLVLAVPGGLVARISLLYGPSRCGREAFFDRAIHALERGEPQTFFADEFRTPLDLATAAAILVRLTGSDVAGLIHVAGTERVSRHELMTRAAQVRGIDPALVRSNLRAEVSLPEPRPADVSLNTDRLASHFLALKRPTIEEALIEKQRIGPQMDTD